MAFLVAEIGLQGTRASVSSCGSSTQLPWSLGQRWNLRLLHRQGGLNPWAAREVRVIWLLGLPLAALSSVLPFSSVAQSCPTLCNPMNRSMPGLPVHHQLPESTQTHVHRVSDAIQPSHPLSSPSPPSFNLSQHQGLFQRVSSSHQVAKVLEFQLQHQSFQ